jgi:hypothetical protein
MQETTSCRKIGIFVRIIFDISAACPPNQRHESQNDRLQNTGVQVVWQIFPQHQQVDIYTGPQLSQMTVYQGDQLCSAAPALPDFVLAVKDIFYRPEM